jgi:DNA-binding transcriptional regulator YhcF (GntR family)
MAGKTPQGFYSGGIVGLNITPDTSDFRRKLQLKLDAMNMPDVDVEANIDVDEAGFRATIANISRTNLKFAATIDGNAKPLEAQLKRLEHRKTKVPVKFDFDYKNAREYADHLVKGLDPVKKNIKSMQDALFDLHPFGDGSDLMKQGNKVRAEIKKIMDLAESAPEKTFGFKYASEGYLKVERELESFVRKTKEANDREVRVKFYADNAKAFEDQLDGIKRKYLDLPNDISASYQSIASRLREVSKQVGDNPDIKYTLNLDTDMRRAKDKIEEFQRKHDELKMDIDLSSKTAAAHLAYFTRPRTINIWADFKGTTGGQLIDDMLKGATGLNGVERNFQSLVNTFNNLDRTVPKLTAVSAVLTDIGSGAVNVAGTVGGLGSSLITMLSAAQTAPAVLGAAGGAFFGIYSAVKTASDEFDVASTKLGGLKTKVGGAFWEDAAKPMRELADEIAPSLIKGLSGIAAEEGNIAVQLMRVAGSTDAQKQIPTILAQSASAVSALAPGLDHAVTGFIRLGSAGSTYLPAMTTWLSGMGAKFDAWSEYVSDADHLSNALKETAEQGGYLMQILGNAGGILGNVFGAFAQGENGLQGMAEAAQKVEDVTSNSMFTQTLLSWRDGAQKAQTEIRSSFGEIGASINSLRDDTAIVMENMGELTGTVGVDIARLASGIGDGLATFSSGAVKGVGSITDALADASPMFSNLLEMAGQLSVTFGGTFSATLTAAAPMITGLAKGTQTIAEAFNALPAPIKGAIGLWITFGKAGASAVGALKQSMLQNITQTLAVKKQMAELGMSTDSASIGFGNLTKAMIAAKTAATSVGESSMIAATELNAVGKTATGISATGEAAEAAAANLKNVGSGAVVAAEGAEKVAVSSSSATGMMGKLKSGANGVAAAFGGWSAIGSALGWGAALGALSIGMSVYGEETQKSAESQNSFNEAAKQTPDILNEMQTGLTASASTMQKNFSETFGWWDKTVQAFSGMDTTGVDSASDSMQKLGLNSTEMAQAATGSTKQFNSVMKDLDKTIENGKINDPLGNTFSHRMTEEASQAKVVKDRMSELREQYIDSFRDKAALVGKGREYVEQLVNEGQLSDSINMTLATQEERTKNLTAAQDKLTSVHESAKKATISANQAQSAYAETQASMTDKVKQVQDLVKGGQSVWDAQANNFSFVSEAGRAASDSLSQLASSGNSMIEAMIESGASLETVKDKNKQLGKSFLDTAVQMGVPEQQAKDLVKQYLSTPKEIETQFKTKSDKAKTDILEYLGYVQQMFPPGQRTQEFNTIMTGVNSGAIKSIDEVAQMAEKLKNSKNTVVLDADNKPVVMSVTEAETYAQKMEDGTYKLNMELAGGDTVLNNLAELSKASDSINKKDVQMFVKADGNALLDVPKLNEIMKNLAFSDNDIEILMQASGNANEVTGSVKEKLEDLGLTPKQIQWILDAYDKVTPQIDGILGKKGTYEQPWNKNLNATNKTDSAVDAANGSLNRFQDKNINLGGNPNPVQQLVRDLKLQDKTISIFGKYEGFLPGTNIPNARTLFGAAATGGAISGPGTSTSDSIPMLLSNGEYVIKASSVAALEKKYGSGFLNRVNSTGSVPDLSRKYTSSALAMAKNAYASGGRVRAAGLSMTASSSDSSLTTALDRLDRTTSDGLRRVEAAAASGMTIRDFERMVLDIVNR